MSIWFLCNRDCRENSRFSSLFAAGDVSRGGTSATQRQKFHTDDVNQCLLNKSGSHGFPNANLFNFTFLLLCSSANELQQNSSFPTEDNISQILTALSEIHRVYIWLLWPFVFYLSFVNISYNNQCNYSLDQSGLLTGFRTDFTSSVWNFCRWVADVRPRETSPAAKSEMKQLFSQVTYCNRGRDY